MQRLIYGVRSLKETAHEVSNHLAVYRRLTTRN